VDVSVLYHNLHEVELARENARKAYELREKVSERERLAIESRYFGFSTGELEKALTVYQLWEQIYPRDFVPYGNEGFTYATLGDYVRAVEKTREALRLQPNVAIGYSNLAAMYECLNPLEDAAVAFRVADEHGSKPKC